MDTGDDYERTVAGFLRYDVLLVNPIKDGLNLVAKEGPLVNARDGVLCLSPEAGAYEELRDAALRVHPYDLEQTAAALAPGAVDAAPTSARLGPVASGPPRRRARPRSGCTTSSRTPADHPTSHRGGVPMHVFRAEGRQHRSGAADGVGERVHERREPGGAVDDDVGVEHRVGRLGRPDADAHPCAEVAAAVEAGELGERRDVALVVARERGRVQAGDELRVTALPLSTGTGGRSSIDMRPRIGASSPCAALTSSAAAIASSARARRAAASAR